MHGGSLGSGAPTGEANGAWRHGGRSQETREKQRELQAWVRLLKATAMEIS
jgi:hypothetical protein